MDHSDLVGEMSQVERLTTQDRLNLARMRRAQQLKVAKQREKEWQKLQNRKDRSSNGSAKSSSKKHIAFQDSVVLLEAAARNDINEVARLLQKGVSADATNDDGLTALHQCCIDNNSDMLKLLLDYGANVNAEDSEKWTPLHAAATCGHLFLVKILISRSANLLAVNADGNMPYDLCDNEETLDFIEAEMSQRGVTQELIDETRASTETLMLVDLEVIAKRGGDLEKPDAQGATPLHIASANGYARVVEYLLEQHVSVDAVDNDLWTPVHAAACWGHLEVLELLVQNGADLNAKNKNEESPADICEDPEIRERIELLRTEQESKRMAEAQKRRVRRSASSNNTRVSSVRRTSLRDKTLTTKKDAREETRLRMKAQEGYNTPDSTGTEPNSITSTTGNGQQTLDPSNTQVATRRASQQSTTNVPTSGADTTTVHANASTPNNNNINNNNSITNNNILIATSGTANNNNNNRLVPVTTKSTAPQNPLYNHTTAAYTSQNSYDASINRRSPEGEDNESYAMVEQSNNKKMGMMNNNTQQPQQQQHSSGEVSTGIFQASNENGKINVQVTVLVDTQNIDHSIAGTLAELKNHRKSRSSTSPENGSVGTKSLPPIELSIVSTPELQSPNAATISKFSGITGDVVSDSTRSRKCCNLM